MMTRASKSGQRASVFEAPCASALGNRESRNLFCRQREMPSIKINGEKKIGGGFGRAREESGVKPYYSLSAWP